MSIKHSIIKELDGKDYVFGGVIERKVSELHNCKTSNVGRRLRELENAGTIEAKYVQIEGRGPKVVQYRLVPSPVVLSNSISQLRLV